VHAWAVFALAGRSLATGSLRGYWRGVAEHARGGGPLGWIATRGLAAVLWLVLLPVVPLLAAHRRRVYGRALETMVREVAAGVEVPRALERGVRMLVRTGMDRAEAQATAERLLAGFLSPGREAASADEARARSRLRPAG
jgi:hypothetical protein